MKTQLLIRLMVIAGLLEFGTVAEAAGRSRGGGGRAAAGVRSGGNVGHFSGGRVMSGGVPMRPVAPQLMPNRGNLGNAGVGRSVAGNRSFNSGAGASHAARPGQTAQDVHQQILAGQMRQSSFRDMRDHFDRTGRFGHDHNFFVPQAFVYAPYWGWYGGGYVWPDSEYYDNSIPDQFSGPVAPDHSAAPAPGSDVNSPADQARAANALEARPDYRQALADLRNAQNEYDQAFARAMESVGASAEYQSLRQERDRANEAVESLRQGGRQPGMDEIYSAASKKLELNSRLSKMIEQATVGDAAVTAAKEKVMEAGQRVDALRREGLGG